MSDVLSIDYNMMSGALSPDEMALLKQYQQLARTLASVKDKLNSINSQISEIHDPDFTNLGDLSSELQKNIGVLGTVFKSTVHNILLQMDSNPLELSKIQSNEYESTVAKSSANNRTQSQNQSHRNIDGISNIEEDSIEVDRINEELGISQEEADIHRQIAHQLESSTQANDS